MLGRTGRSLHSSRWSMSRHCCPSNHRLRDAVLDLSFVREAVAECYSTADGRTRFDLFVQRLAEAAGHADRRWLLEAYLTGLLLPGERKSIEPMAARLDPRHVSRAPVTRSGRPYRRRCRAVVGCERVRYQKRMRGGGATPVASRAPLSRRGAHRPDAASGRVTADEMAAGCGCRKR